MLEFNGIVIIDKNSVITLVAGLILLTLNIFYCRAIIQTMDHTQVINLPGLLCYI